MKLLVVEDNRKLSASLKEGLEQEGYAVDCLYDGAAATRRLLVGGPEYDLVILDVMLPEKDGLEVCSSVRERNVMVPILMLTAKDATTDKIVGLDAGADDYLIKPFSFDELLARIRALLRRPNALVPDRLTSGPLTLDTGSRTARLHEEKLALTLREFSILEFLLRHPGQVVTREQILSNVWDRGFDSFSNVVDVHMKNIRRKLGAYGRRLRAVRGIGYVLEA